MEEYTKLIAIGPSDADCWAARARLLVHAGKFREAAEDLEQAAEADPGNDLHLLRAAPIRLYVGDASAYRRDSRLMYKRFAESPENYSVAERTAKVCLLLPDPAEGIGSLGELSGRFLGGSETDRANSWRNWTKALAEYRADHFEAAMDWIVKARGENGGAESAKCCEFLMAMAEYKLGRSGQARAAMEAAVREMSAAVPAKPEGEFYENWFILQIVRREAIALIK